MATFISNSPAETHEFAANLARSAVAGWVIGLVGDLGAGKTHFVKGFAEGLGVSEPVLSPTFALVHVYSTGRLPLYHLDLYRLETDEQIRGAGLDEYFAPDGCAIIEWWDRWHGAAPPQFRLVQIEPLGDSQRRIHYVEPGS